MSEDGDGAKRSPEATTHNEASGVIRSLMQVGSITGPVVVNGELPPVPARPESAPSVEALYAENARQLAPPELLDREQELDDMRASARALNRIYGGRRHRGREIRTGCVVRR